MDITTKFQLDQEVWAISHDYASRIVFCETCKREGVVTIGSEQFTCPKCHGTSKHPQHVGQRWFISEHKNAIGRIQTTHFSHHYITEDREEDRITYMIQATGVGSGQIWKERDLFASEAEALEECARRNAGKVFTNE